MSTVLARRAVAPASTQGCSGGDSKATDASVRGEYSEDDWVLIGNIAPMS